MNSPDTTRTTERAHRPNEANTLDVCNFDSLIYWLVRQFYFFTLRRFLNEILPETTQSHYR
jgi:hypothetical protein